MSKETSIEWADSTLNLQMGCDGCELWNLKAGVRTCYAGQLTERYGGRKGWPDSFGEPKLFLDRLEPALRWPDLTGQAREKKPWLDGLPRVIFLDDMGDTFTESLPLDWLAPLLPAIADSPHQWLLLTKRGRRMAEFSRSHPLPANVWPGVSVTNHKTYQRIESLLEVQGGGPKWISAEPLLSSVDFHFRDWNEGQIAWCVIGGMSGPGSIATNVGDIRVILEDCQMGGVAAFVKQLGSNFTSSHYEYWSSRGSDQGSVDDLFRWPLVDPKGGDMDEWPEDLRIRKFPSKEATCDR